ncbi:DEKNAAC104435 [Brettanomyces naardenensis]|uniref:DEKNAAC104435 n=1 Tax=Brettanomyces naardenensis TaxID=13370 RepID=A0A448YR38_BRENA|nr:DEKNAAC104435 [Brettanomyces naardenensis]
MNLKPSKMRGIKSEAMLLAAERESEQAESGFEVEVVRPPREGEAGQQVEFKGYERGGEDTTKRLKKKDWEEIAELLRTNEAGEVCFKEAESTLGLTSPGGIRVTCQVKTLTNSKVR